MVERLIIKKENNMKKLILSIAAVAGLLVSTQAQTEKGKFLLGGTAQYQSSKTDLDGAKASQLLSIVPNVGYFVSDNVALGTGVGYNWSKTPGASATGQNQSVVVNPFGRYYASLNDQFKFFGQVAVPLAFGTVKSVDANGDTGSKTGSSTSIGAVVSPGFAWFPTKKIGIEFAFKGISYNKYTVKDAADNDIKGAGNETFNVGTNFFTPQIGVQFHL